MDTRCRMRMEIYLASICGELHASKVHHARTDSNSITVNHVAKGTKAGEFTVTATTLSRNNTSANQLVYFWGYKRRAAQPLTASLKYRQLLATVFEVPLTATITDAAKSRLKTSRSPGNNDVTLSGTEVTTNTQGQATVIMTSNIAGQHNNVVVSPENAIVYNKTFSLSVLPDESSAKIIKV